MFPLLLFLTLCTSSFVVLGLFFREAKPLGWKNSGQKAKLGACFSLPPDRRRSLLVSHGDVN